MTLCELQAEGAAITVVENKDVIFAELATRPRRHFFNIGDHALSCERGHDLVRIGE